ncbi:MAG: acyl-CoA dehydrogenase family protein [Thermaerobacter sp.]|nr:acyl-CoA dehydrogenase family protein [Thermaerobacter sp.]
MADWLFHEEHDMFRETARRVVAQELAPHVEEWERDGFVPKDVFRRLGQGGYLGVRLPEEYGGLGGDALYEAVWIEELAKVGAGGIGAALSGHSTIGLTPLWRWGTPAQRQRYLVPGVRGELVAALAVTEAAGGSDVAALRTVAHPVAGGFRLQGSKLFVTNGVGADILVVAATVDPARRHRGISLFIVEKSWPGVKVLRRLDKLGWRSSDTAELFFDGVEVPAENLLGEVYGGFGYLMEIFLWERITMALAAVALAQKAVDEAIGYARARRQFGRPLNGFQVTRHGLVDLTADIEKARVLARRALYVHWLGQDATVAAAMAKAYAGEMVRRVTDGALQVLGGNGYMMPYPLQRYWRDARIVSIGGGTTEVMREILVKRLGIAQWMGG